MLAQCDPIAGLSERLRSHPQFPRAFQHYVSNILGWRHNQSILNKLVGSYTRSLIVGQLAFLHFDAAQNRDHIDGGATYAQLWQLCEARKTCSPRILKTVLALCRLAGFVTVRRGKHDRRLKILVPTEKLIRFMTDWHEKVYECFDILTGSQTFASRMRDDPSCLAHHLVSTGRPYFAENIQIAEVFPEIIQLFEQDGGFMIATAIIDAQIRHEPLSSQIILARSAGVSASQVRNVIAFLQSRDLIDDGDATKLNHSHKLMAIYQEFVARELAFYSKYALNIETYLTQDRMAEAKSR